MIGWQDGEGASYRGSLFAAFAALSQGEAWSFPALRPHQMQSWHAFTVQVAALALVTAGVDDLPGDEGGWRALLLALTPDQPGGEAWELAVDDWSRPALLQPPVVAATNRADYRNRLATPDEVDTLITSKNHDIKQERIVASTDEHWLFALVCLQTTEGFLGAGNYGISRMNGGFATRMSLGVRPVAGGAAGAFRRDVARLVADARRRPDRRTGTGLLWLVPWDGTAALDYYALDELYVEVCRRVRLRRGPAGIEAVAAGSKTARVAAKELLGRTGDPWVPMKADGSSSHTPTGAGFGHRQMAQLLDRKKIIPPLLAQDHPDDDREGLAIVASALVRGQGKTEGLHRRTVPISRFEQIAGSGDSTALDRIGDVARTRSTEVSEAGKRLRRALIMLVQGGPEKARLDDDAAARKVDPWVGDFDHAADRLFFDDAFWAEAADPDGDPTPHRQAWRTRLRALAGATFVQAAEAAPRTAMRRVRAIARARTMLDAQMTNWFKEIA